MQYAFTALLEIYRLYNRLHTSANIYIELIAYIVFVVVPYSTSCTFTETGRFYMKYNQAKMQTLAGIAVLNEKDIPANSITLTTITGNNKEAMRKELFRLRHLGYVNPKYDTSVTLGCSVRYTLTQKGKRVLSELLDRYENGVHLNLKKLPSVVDYSRFELLPGRKEVMELFK